MEIKNKLYIQRFFAKKLHVSDLWKAVTYTQYEGRVIPPFWYKKEIGYTSTLDLTQSLDEIFSKMKSNTRNEVRRAEKEGITFEYNFDYDAFIPFYNEFSESKGLHENIDYDRVAKYDKTYITIAKHGDTILAMHAIVVNEEDSVAMLLLSGSQRLETGVDRKMIGWGNRYLHFKEFELFKSLGIKKYEWNGVVIDPEDKECWNITQFKLSFGSESKESVLLKTPLFVFMKAIQNLLSRRK